ncbi:MAG: tRNA (guanosine(46)-N7)-methyltransferase TrmB, partial [Ignavibacteria bacterium]|nr:tRNA (guanosine(46)-N7)-methyltransferase TrmB [Ignavibacteria bacterium]
VGCGKGQLLLDYSENNPVDNILGIELRLLPVDWLKDVIEGYRLPNVSVLWYSVVNGLVFIEDSSIKKIFYLFPDPWHKKKHQKRRAFTSFLLKEFKRILKPDGQIFLATDVPEVHEYHIEVLAENSEFEVKIISDDSEWDLPVTNKEKFCRLKNIHFDRIICRIK